MRSGILRLRPAEPPGDAGGGPASAADDVAADPTGAGVDATRIPAAGSAAPTCRPTRNIMSNAKTTNATEAASIRSNDPRDRAAVRRLASGASGGVGGETPHQRGVFCIWS